jgi:hypothetical protein
MREKQKLEWETIFTNEHDQCTKRAEIYRGWLILNQTIHPGTATISESMIYIPDPLQEWNLIDD